MQIRCQPPLSDRDCPIRLNAERVVWCAGDAEFSILGTYEAPVEEIVRPELSERCTAWNFGLKLGQENPCQKIACAHLYRLMARSERGSDEARRRTSNTRAMGRSGRERNNA